MTSYSDNAYDITNLFCCFEKFLAYTHFLPSFIVLRQQMVELNWRGGGGGGFWPHLSIIGVYQTLSKIGLKLQIFIVELNFVLQVTVFSIYRVVVSGKLGQIKEAEK